MRTVKHSVPRWLLFPVGLGIARISIYQGDLWWLLGIVLVLLDAVTLGVLLQLTQRFPLGRRPRIRDAGIYAIAAGLYVGTSMVLQSAIVARDRFPTPDSESRLGAILGELFTFLIWMAVAHAITYLRRYRAQEADALRLRLDLAGTARSRAAAELRSFENEINPRFLIGALRAAAQHASSDPAHSERLLVEIGDVVRAARPTARSTTLADEIAALAPFIALEKERLGADIILTARVPDDLQDAPLPPLVLAALVREALRTARAGIAIAIDISASAVAGVGRQQMQVDVVREQERAGSGQSSADDGMLARTVEHLRTAYAGEATIDVTRSRRGVRLRLVVPLDNDASVPATPASEDDVPLASPATRGRATFATGLSLWFLALLAVNVNTTLHQVRPNGLVVPPRYAIPEALLATVCVTLALYVAIRLTRHGFTGPMVARHVKAAVALGLVNAVSRAIFVTAIGPPYSHPTFGGVLGRTVSGMMIYFIFAGILGAFEYARRHRSAEEESLTLRAELAEAERRRMEAELRALKAELNPHFLGNALAGAASLVHSDPAAAHNMLAQVADVVGAIVTRVGTQEVTLQEEIDGLVPFIAVEQSRFGDRLSVQWNVEEQARVARVPHLILQPLVENAVKHGLAASGRGGRIVVAGRKAGDRLELSVADDGARPAEPRREAGLAGGVGLSNSRARLAQLYGSDASLLLEAAPGPGAGTIVRVTLPWH